MTSNTIALSGYQISEQIYEGSRTLVYRGMRETDSQPTIVKVLRNPHPHFKELVQFRSQYIITRHLESPHIVHPLTLERCGNGYALVMTDEGAISLGDYWQQSDQNLSVFLNVALQLAEALHYLGQQRIIHKDIKPANILIHPETQQVKLIDFSISSLLPKETQEIQNPNVLEGTLAYISPEQTGRMNRGIDYRTDFYSLGVTFYELLVGELPFSSDDPMDLVHAHIAQTPQFPTGREEISSVIADIVLKLMAKNAEERYQSALGLKHDLEKCLSQWQEMRTIEPFELGERDLCDRFLIPEKLYGREKEIAQLLAAFERVSSGTSEMMLVAGYSGVGKTAVVNEVHKPIVEVRGYFIKGKFDQFNRNIPFSAFVQAFRDLMGQLLSESDADLADWKAKILDALGDNAQVIIDVVPELERIIGTHPPVPELSGSAVQNRFNLLFEKFIQVLTTKNHPLVLFLDDLQWADSASLNLLQLLMGETEMGYLLVLGAYRDNEVSPAHPLMLTLNEIAKNEAIVNTITLEPLSQLALNHLIADTLSCPSDLTLPLTELAYQKTKGNPFFATQFLKGLQEDGWISFNPELGYWQCDLTAVRRLSLTDDVVGFIAAQLQKLPAETQAILKLAACIGNQFDLETLAIVSDRRQDEVANDLWQGLQEGLVMPENEIYLFFQEGCDEQKNWEGMSANYRFLHDRIQQAAYSLIPPELQQTTHLKIGRRLLAAASEERLEERVFAIVNHLNRGRMLIENSSECRQLAQLNLVASQKAQSATAYSAASTYAAVGLELLPQDSWQSQYALTLALYEVAVETAGLNLDFEAMEQWIEVCVEHAKTLLDKVKVYIARIQAQMSQGKPQEAIDTALDILSKLGLSIPQQPGTLSILGNLIFTKWTVGKNIDRLAELPPMENPTILAAMRILAAISSAVYISRPNLYPLVVMNQVRLSHQYGNAPMSPYAYSIYGVLLCGVVGDIAAGYQWGQLAERVLDRVENQEFACKTNFTIYLALRHCREHLRQTNLPFLDAYRMGIDLGDLEFASYSLALYLMYSFWRGKFLADLKEEGHNYCSTIESLKQASPLAIYRQILQVISNLLDKELDDLEVQKQQLSSLKESDDRSGLFHFYLNQLTLDYLFEEYELAAESANLATDYLENTVGLAIVPIFHFYEALTALARYPKLDKAQQKHSRQRVKANRKKMTKWMRFAPMNYCHKVQLLEAEWYRVLGDFVKAIEMYDCAIAGAKANEYIQEEALANELAAKFYLEWGKEKIAATYMQEAYYGYARWGAKAKTDHLEQTYPQLLTPILQQQRIEFNPITSLENLTQTLSSTQQSNTLSSTNLSEALDFTSILQAGQVISSTLKLDTLLGEIVRIILTNSGAQKVALLIPQEEQWQLRAIAQLNREGESETSAELQPLTAESPLPIRLVRYVKNTQHPVLINEAKTEISGILEGYLLKHQPQSIFCTPLLNQNKLVAILYLEHPTTQGVFTSNRQTIVQFLCAQAAIALENAQLYARVQQALQELQQAQLQLVQSEKMSALGNLVAGVAHEINNPVGFLQGNIQPAREYVQDLLGLIDLYQEKVPNPDAELEDEIEAIDLEFVREDLPKLLNSMNVGVDRIRNISNSLRTFSRQDQDQKTAFNLHEGLDSTLLILKHRTKANEQRPKIEVIKEYGALPDIECFPGQLNQVFMNILANAIDAFEEANQGKNYQEIEANPNIITLHTSVVGEQAQIRIQDNGCGMKSEVREQIFEQGFTTKGVGKGTGLGMAIARQIVEEKHGGTLSCHSELGKGTEFTIELPFDYVEC